MTENLATATKVATLEHSFSQCFPNLKTSGSKSHEAMWDGFDIHLNFNVQEGLPWYAHYKTTLTGENVGKT